MTLKLKNILEIDNVLKSVIDNKELKVDALLKFQFLGILNKINNIVENYELVKNEKIKEYGTEIKNEDGEKTIGIKPDDTDAITKFTTDMNKVIDADVEIDIQKLKAESVCNSGLTSNELLILYPIMEQ